MQFKFSTEMVHPRDRLTAWQKFASKYIAEFDSKPADCRKFGGQISVNSLGNIRFGEIRTSSIEVQRGERHISADHDDLLLCLQKLGTSFVTAITKLKLAQGDSAILDSGTPFSARLEGDCVLWIIRLPRRDLEKRLGTLKGVRFDQLDLRRSEVALVAAMVSTALETPLDGRSLDVAREAILDLIAIALRDQLRTRGQLTRSKQRVLFAIRRAIELYFADLDLSASRIASVAGVSVRYANALLASDGTCLTKLIATTRLERCANALRDPAQSHLSLQEIAFTNGFRDQSIFGKRFRKAFGATPSQYRRQQFGSRSAATVPTQPHA